MNSAYTNLEQSLAAKEMGAKQDEGPCWWRAGHSGWRFSDSGIYPTLLHTEDVAALPWITDDPNEQSALGLLESLGWRVNYQGQMVKPHWRARHPSMQAQHHSYWGDDWPWIMADSPGALFTACYQRWRGAQPRSTIAAQSQTQ